MTVSSWRIPNIEIVIRCNLCSVSLLIWPALQVCRLYANLVSLEANDDHMNRECVLNAKVP